MRRTVTLFALTIALLLAGCGGRQEKAEFERWQRQVSAAGEISFSARITGEWSGGAASFDAWVTAGPEETAVTVTAPETIAGVTVRTKAGSDTLEFDGVVLELAAGRKDALPPCAAGGILADAVRNGRLLYTGRSGEVRTVALTAPGGETVTLWRSADGDPVYAEIARQETVELKLTIENWQIKERTE